MCEWILGNIEIDINCSDIVVDSRAPLLKWINFNPSMDE